MSEKFDRKGISRTEAITLIAEQLQMCIEPICKEMGEVMEGLHIRVQDAESALNALISEMKEWKRKQKELIN